METILYLVEEINDRWLGGRATFATCESMEEAVKTQLSLQKKFPDAKFEIWKGVISEK